MARAIALVRCPPLAGLAVAGVTLTTACASVAVQQGEVSQAVVVTRESAEGRLGRVAVLEQDGKILITGTLRPRRAGWAPDGHIDIVITSQHGTHSAALSTYLYPEDTLLEQEPEVWEYRAHIPWAAGAQDTVTVAHHIDGHEADGLFQCGNNQAATTGEAPGVVRQADQ